MRQKGHALSSSKGFAPIIILAGILVIVLVGGGAYYYFKVKTPVQKTCTLEAKICPDGTSVGRSGPNCEFSPCPSPKPTTDFPLEAQLQYQAKARNAFRKASLNTLLEILTKYSVDHNGQLPPVITLVPQRISKSGTDLCQFLIIPNYNNSINIDTGTENSGQVIDCLSNYDTGFTIVKNNTNQVMVAAPLAELGEIISITKQF